jgi:hypothetical protein
VHKINGDFRGREAINFEYAMNFINPLNKKSIGARHSGRYFKYKENISGSLKCLKIAGLLFNPKLFGLKPLTPYLAFTI